jgi:hypothetical protein
MKKLIRTSINIVKFISIMAITSIVCTSIMILLLALIGWNNPIELIVNSSEYELKILRGLIGTFLLAGIMPAWALTVD